MNGTLRSEAQYYGDSEKYTGSAGSSTNMYVVEDVYDFITAQHPTGNYKYYRLVSDIDLNDHPTYKGGFTTALYGITYMTYWYGNGHKIKNIVVTNTTSSVFWFYYVSNIDFVNMIIINSTFPITGVTIRNCDFGIFLSNSVLNLFHTDKNDASEAYTDCSFNIKGTFKEAVITGTINLANTCTRCHFNFDVSGVIDENKGFLYSTTDYKTNFTNCYFTGKINNKGTSQCYFINAIGTYSNCYFALEYTGIPPMAYSNSNLKYSTCFIDKELFEKNGTTLGELGITELTTEQAQDTDYLNSIGFVVVPIG